MDIKLIIKILIIIIITITIIGIILLNKYINIKQEQKLLNKTNTEIALNIRRIIKNKLNYIIILLSIPYIIGIIYLLKIIDIYEKLN